MTSRSRTEAMINQALRLYAEGHSLNQVGAIIGRSGWTVREILISQNVPRRPRAHGRSGPDHPSWLGDQVGYRGAHGRVWKARGQPQECSRCGRTDDQVKYHWANLTGRYHDVMDYERMCQPCHIAFDKARKAPS